ncbi:probable glycosyltransferase At5g03795 [Olea europaea subsp. europaea]|uniref:Probable glycosyltransferase At5g03795 n=1 Tax=Olea europaea subsp. europaea TaxID=158383 RepID=A0A8S0SVR5_OLEEU|nr:probable glycosyltransferase At5g03795 [Olea europaea subsp. europaea]
MERWVCIWWKKSSSSTRLLGLMVPLIAASLLVVFGSSGSSGGLFSSNYHPLVWSSIAGGQPVLENSNNGGSDSVEKPMDGVEPWDLQRRVGDVGETEEAYSHDYVPNQSVTPPLAVEEIESTAQEQSLEKGKSSKTSTNGSAVLPFSNETDTRPLHLRIIRKFSNLERLEAKLQQARTAIRDAHMRNQSQDQDYVPAGPMYWSTKAFHRSYLEMEKHFKVFVYEEGEHPIFHNGPCGSIYSTEGGFIYRLEISKFRTRDPERAHIFFLPFSVASIVHFIYDRGTTDYWRPMKLTVSDYIHLLAGKYPYWNRSLGVDHFMLACHDWGPELSKSVPELFKNSVRALCNANTSEGFDPSKDVSIPEINLPGGRMNGLIGGPSPSRRRILVFYAGGVHGPIRPILLEHWENKDEDVQIHRYLPKSVSYLQMMRKSKYCVCPSGYEVASPRMVEALYTGCVPVIIKDHYIAPFSDILNWKSFAVEIPVEEIPNLKKILAGISTRQYIRMQRRGIQVRRHFEFNSPPKRYDVFHMILHSIWLRRLNVRLHGVKDS